ncbi:hypothetical protein [Sphingorhabdus sp. YGSMI21]|uniref:hypothetical protein n=2 Tax=Sphingomonadaceae TaxID=41297 RepID=UPI0013DB7BB4|nr:hypothetical protein [Sphingorhabdus sp. YGSMI21]
MKIAFLFIAEAYQTYHGYTIALALAKREGCDVVAYYNDPTVPEHLERIAAANGVTPVPAKRLKRGFLGWLIQSIRILGMAKNQVMRANMRELLSYDVIVSVENTVAWLAKRRKSDRPLFVFKSHGAGDRDVAWHPRIAEFDLLLPHGTKTAERYVEQGLGQPAAIRTTGYLKTDVTERLREGQQALFDTARPTVIYNPHKDRKQSSWRQAIEPMLDQFAGQDIFNLIVAPHVKMFRRRSASARQRWENRSTDSILIDTCSDRLLDNSYTVAADIYIGDVSSQVYEFTARPRPCVFLNFNKIDWRDNPNYLFWQMGEVIEDPAEIFAAVARARDLHPQYIEIQKKLTSDALGDDIRDGAEYAADAIVDYYRHGRTLRD